MSIPTNDVSQILRDAGVPMLKTAVVMAPDDKTITQKPKAVVGRGTKFLSDDVTALLSLQVGNEIFAAYSYHGVAAWFELTGLQGFSKYHEKQGMDEIGHAKKIFKFMLEAGAEPNLPAISAPMVRYDSVEQTCQAIVDHEKSVTESWRKIGKQALEDQDMATLELSGWFLREQTEEEAAAITLLQRVKMAGKSGIITVDAQLLGD